MTNFFLFYKEGGIIMNFSERLQYLRKSRNMSQPELAAIINVSDRSISAWERGITSPNTEIVIKLADYFNVSADYLLGRDKDVDDPQLDENIRSIQRAYEKLGIIDKEKMTAINRLMFENAFEDRDSKKQKDDNDDKDTI